MGNDCNIIPGKYFGFLPPKTNYIKTANYKNYIGIIWNTNDNFDFKISVYNDYKVIDWKCNAKIYSKNDSLLLEYNILDTLDFQRGIRLVNDSANYYMNKMDYNYLDLNRIIGIEKSTY
jgi:hypothetical protein